MSDPKAVLHRYLRSSRAAIVWKAEGLSEYDVRRPLTPTGTNLLGLVKHLACVELGYFGDTFGRPPGISIPGWADDAPVNADMWATPEESRADILDLYARAQAHSDGTIEALELDAAGHVSWWGGTEVTLHWILVHVIAETNRHAGHADIVREMVDGSAGLQEGNTNLPDDVGASYWQQLEDAAAAFR